MSRSDRYHSIFERISWTRSLSPLDRAVLGALATFGSFKTGRNCRPSIAELATRANVPLRSCKRALARLEAEGWIVATAEIHRQPTTYAITLDRLATHWLPDSTVEGQIGTQDTDDPEGQIGTQDIHLEGQIGTQDIHLEGQIGTQDGLEGQIDPQEPVLSAKLALHPQYVQIPSTEHDPQYDHDPQKNAALRAEPPEQTHTREPRITSIRSLSDPVFRERWRQDIETARHAAHAAKRVAR